MEKEKSLFLGLLLALVALFALCGFSLVQCFVYGTSSEDSNFLEIAYLFVHLVIVAVIFYLAFRAYKTKSSIIQMMMIEESGVKNRKSLIVSGILSGVFFFIGIYSMLHVFGLKTPPLNYLSSSLSHDLMNAGYLFGVIALAFFLYPFLHKQEIKAE